MNDNNGMERGWSFAVKVLGADAAAHVGYEYITKISEAISQLEDNINNHPYRNQDIAHFKGYVLEEYSADTFNINAAVEGSKDFAEVLHSNAPNSADVRLHTKSGTQDYSMKAYATPEKSGIAQAKLANDTNEAAYICQKRVVPEDHLDGAISETHRRALMNTDTRPEVAEAYSDAEHNLTDRISNNDGVESNSIKAKDLERIAQQGHDQRFSSEEEGITLASVIKNEHLLNQALKAGLTSAAITVAIQITPEIYKAIDYLIKNRELDINQIKKIGTKAITADAEGFLRGSISCSLYILCKEGLLGEILKKVDPTLLGTVVAIVLETLKNSIMVAAGKMTAKQMGGAFVEGVVVSAGYLLGVKAGAAIGGKIGGAIGQLLGFETPVFGYVFGYVVGSLLGCAFAVVYNIGKNKLISFCVDTGFTCFGLVEQNYELPEKVLNEIGIDTIKISRTNVTTTDITKITTTGNIGRTQYETVNITVLRRGVVGVNKVGYVF